MVVRHSPAELQPPRASNTAIQSLRLFVSIDLVGSTQYKQKRPGEWQQPLKQFFQRVDSAVEEIQKINPEARVWKRAGDEAILHFSIRSEAELFRFVSAASQTYHQIADQIQQSDFALGVKAAAWLCPVDEVRNIELYADDWIGLNMDEGFRIAHHFSAVRGFALSCELAYLLASATEESSRFVYLGCQELRGVWDGRYYPVIWYAETKIQETAAKIPYDARFRSGLLSDALSTTSCSGAQLGEHLTPIISEIYGLQKRLNEIRGYLRGLPQDA